MVAIAAERDQVREHAFCDLFLDPPRRRCRRAHPPDAGRAAQAGARDVRHWTLAELEGAADDIARWRANLTETSRYRLTLALRQALGAAVRWRYMTRNPAVDAGRNPEPRKEELLPFTPAEVDLLAVELGRCSGRSSCSPPRPGCARTSGPRSNAATSTGGPAVWCSAASPTAC